MKKGMTAALITAYVSSALAGGTFDVNSYPIDYIGGFYVHYDPKTSAVIKEFRGSLWAGYYYNGVFFMQGEMPSSDTVWEIWASARNSFIRNEGQGFVRSDIHLTQVDCKAKKWRFLQQTEFNGYWGEGDIIDSSVRPTAWKYAIPGSHGEMSLMITCQRDKNERKKRAARK